MLLFIIPSFRHLASIELVRIVSSVGCIQWEEVKYDSARGMFWLPAAGRTSALSLYKLETTGSSETACSVCFMHIEKHCAGPSSQNIDHTKICRGLRRVRKITKSDCYPLWYLSVRPPSWNNSAPTGRIFMKFGMWVFFEKSIEKIQVSLKSDKYKAYFTWRPIYIFDHISLSPF